MLSSTRSRQYVNWNFIYYLVNTRKSYNKCWDLMFDVQRLKIEMVIVTAAATCTLCVPNFKTCFREFVNVFSRFVNVFSKFVNVFSKFVIVFSKFVNVFSNLFWSDFFGSLYVIHSFKMQYDDKKPMKFRQAIFILMTCACRRRSFSVFLCLWHFLSKQELPFA